MKVYAKWWWGFGLLSAFCALMAPYIGWFAVVNALLVGAAWYVLFLAKERVKRISENKDLLKKMNQAQKSSFWTLDEREVKNIKALRDMMMPLLIGGNALLNIYTFIFYRRKGLLITPFQALYAQTGDAPGWVWLFLALVFAAMFYVFFSIRVDEIMKGFPKKGSYKTK